MTKEEVQEFIEKLREHQDECDDLDHHGDITMAIASLQIAFDL